MFLSVKKFLRLAVAFSVIMIFLGCIGQPPATPTPTPPPTATPTPTVTPTPTAPPARDYFKIGVITSLTGSLARGGYVTKRGYDTWADQVNAEGGILINGKRYRVQLVYYDAKSDPAFAAKAAEKMIAEGIDFALGPYSSACTLGSAPIFEKYKVPMITGSAESHLIPEKKFKWTFQVLVTTKESAKAYIEFIKKTLPVKTVAIIGADDAFSKGLAEAFKAEATDKGFDVVFYEIFPVDITDLSPVISKVKPLKPDVFIVAGHPTNHVVAVRNSKELGFNPKVFIVHWGVDTADFLGELKSDANYVIGETMWSPKAPWKDPLFGTAGDFAKLFEGLHGHSPDYTEASCAATGVYLQQVLQKHGFTPPFDDEKMAKFRDALEKDSFPTLLGEIAFSTEPEHWHVNIGLVKFLPMLQIRDQKPAIIYPEELKEVDVIFPKPPWGAP